MSAYTQNNLPETFDATTDIAIIGGGLAGMALACALKDLPFKLMLIDATPLSNISDHRLIALTKSSCDFLVHLDVWSTLADHAAPIKAIHVSEYKKFGAVKLQANELDISEFGHVIPASYIQMALQNKLKKIKNITSLRPAKFIDINIQNNSFVIDQENTIKKFKSKILIAADGTQSTVRNLLGIPSEMIDYQQQALVTITHLQRSHKNTAFERFHQTGALAFLPLTENRVATIWTDRTEIINECMQLSDQDFLRKLQQQMGYYCGRLIKIEKRYTYPLKALFIKPTDQIQKNTILIGNAAHTLHPIAAQGFNLALTEIAALVNYLKNQPVENLALPYSIEDIQHFAVHPKFSHYLHRLFTATLFPFPIARQAGMTLLDCLKPAKKMFIKRMLGKNNL